MNQKRLDDKIVACKKIIKNGGCGNTICSKCVIWVECSKDNNRAIGLGDQKLAMSSFELAKRILKEIKLKMIREMIK